jgi:hypothetical protein
VGSVLGAWNAPGGHDVSSSEKRPAMLTGAALCDVLPVRTPLVLLAPVPRPAAGRCVCQRNSTARGDYSTAGGAGQAVQNCRPLALILRKNGGVANICLGAP